jgi:hypothetical protein
VDGVLILEAITQRYNFRKGPDINLPKSEVDKIGLRFEFGSFEIAGILHNISDCTIFADGMVINTKNTDDADAFWDDLTNWLRAENYIRDFAEAPVLRYVSQIVAEFEHRMSQIMPSFDRISGLISDKLTQIYKTDVLVEMARFDFEYDKITAQSSLNVPRFIIERRQGIPFTRERYFCSAPMRTPDHLNILQEIENELA